MKPAVKVRRALPADAGKMLDMIEALAKYEKMDAPDAAARKRLVDDAFAERPRFEVYLAELEDGTVTGYALVYDAYSTFLALPTLFLHDLFVLPEQRSAGAGFALFQYVVREAERRGSGRIEWLVLDWNQLARDFYQRLGAKHLVDWRAYQLTPDRFAEISGDGEV